MNIWIDLVNSPQVLFFRPILTELQRRGHNLFITSRDFAQTCSLANEYKISNTPIGQHGGEKLTGMIYHNLNRTFKLCHWVKAQPTIDLAVSHNSYTQALASSLLRIPFVTLMDYEYQPLNKLCFRLARRVIVPAIFPDEMLISYGAQIKAKKYSGIKEELYLADFKPEDNFLSKHKIDNNKIIIVVRPPATWTLYHRFENPIFEYLMQYLAEQEDTIMIFLPRIHSQSEWAKKLCIPQLIIPTQTMNGPNLLYAADIVISGGGTMNREAAVLGTPTFSVFGGKMGAVDEYLIEKGRIIQIKEKEELKKIRIEKKKFQPDFIRAPQLVSQVSDYILGY